LSIKIGLEADTLEEAEQIMKWWHQPGPATANGTGRAPRKATVTRISKHKSAHREKLTCPVCGKSCVYLKSHMTRSHRETPPGEQSPVVTAPLSESDNKGEG
jgi:hypothetical protein